MRVAFYLGDRKRDPHYFKQLSISMSQDSVSVNCSPLFGILDRLWLGAKGRTATPGFRV